MRNTHSKFIDKILKEIWSEIDIKMNDGIYTEEFLMSLYNNLSEYVDDEFATEFLKEIETTSGKEKESGEEKDFDSEKLDMMTAAEREQYIQKKKQDIEEKTYVKNKKTGNKIKNIGEKILKKTIKELDNLINNEFEKT